MKITDTQKQLISDKLSKALFTETLMVNEAARNLGINATYVSMIRNPKQWDRCSIGAWEAANDWYNSGQKLSEYSVAHSCVRLPEPTHEVKPTPEVKKDKERLLDEINKSELVKRVVEDAPLAVKPLTPQPGQQFTDTARLKVSLDIEINLVVNGQKVQVK